MKERDNDASRCITLEVLRTKQTNEKKKRIKNENKDKERQEKKRDKRI